MNPPVMRAHAMRRMLLLVLAAAAPASGGAPAAETLVLNGDWQYLGRPSAEVVPSRGKWQTVRVPCQQRSTDSIHYGFFRRTFDVPTSMLGRRLFLRFRAVKFTATVFVNGQEVASHVGGYEPFEVEVNDVVKPKGNELLLRTGDWSTLCKAPVDFSKPLKRGARVTDRVQRTLMAPVGSRSPYMGPWEDVELIARPDVYVEDVFVLTSVRERTITAQVAVRNLGPRPAQCRVAAAVLVGESEVLSLPASMLTAAANASATCQLARTWERPKLWSPDHPHLYHLRVAMVSGGTRDEATVRFGFREFWCDGPHFVLNGVRTNLMATSSHPHPQFTRGDALETYAVLKRGHCKAMRLHAQPWSTHWYDAADEVGMLLIHESAIYCYARSYAIEDARFWQNCRHHIREQIRRHRNHPSIIMWSMENEILACGGDRVEGTEKELARLGRVAKAEDPTRPIEYEADADPMGEADVVNLHYPYDYPYVKAYPNVAYWLEQPTQVRGYPRRVWTWDRKKPLYFGEFLWSRSTHPTAWHTVWFGDEVYVDTAQYRFRAMAASWRMQVEAYRYLGVSGMCPYTIFHGGQWKDSLLYRAQADAFRPIAVIVKEYDSRFFEGEAVTRTVSLHNDTYEPADLSFDWRLGSGRPEGSETIHLEPGGAARRTLRFKAPPARAFALELVLSQGGKERDRAQKGYRSYRRGPTIDRPASSVGLYDPAGRTKTLFERAKLPYRSVASPMSVPSDVRVLVVGANAWTAEAHAVPVVRPADAAADGIGRFVRTGGRVIVLEQRTYPPDLPTLGIKKATSTMAFIRDLRHPLVDGLPSDAFKFWRGDHVVVRGEIVRPSRGNHRVVVDCGSCVGLDASTLIELYEGSGLVILSQLAIVEKFDTEPMARAMLDRLLARAQTYRDGFSSCAVVSDRATFREYVDALGVEADELSGPLAAAELGGYGTIMASGAVDAVVGAGAVLRSFVQEGGRLVLHGYAPSEFARVAEALGIDGVLKAGCRPPVRYLRSDPLTLCAAHEDLYWQAGSRQAAARSGGIAAFVVEPRQPGAVALTSPAVQVLFAVGRGSVVVDQIRWDTEGRSKTRASQAAVNLLTNLGVRMTRAPEGTALEGEAMTPQPGLRCCYDRGTYIHLGATGYLEGQVRFAVAGRCRFTLLAKGTKAGGAYPKAELFIDGLSIGTVDLLSDDWHRVGIEADVERGQHALRVKFTNDFYDPPDDRNMQLDRVMIAYGGAGGAR